MRKIFPYVLGQVVTGVLAPASAALLFFSVYQDSFGHVTSSLPWSRYPSQVEKRTVKIGVGLLPYIWIGSVWQKRRPVMTNLAAYRSRVSIDTTSFRMVALGMATSLDGEHKKPGAALLDTPGWLV